MIEEKPEKTVEPIRKHMEIPKDLHSLYMNNLAEMQEEYDFQKLYAKLLFSIDLGKDMLPDEYETLKEEAERVLLSSDTYPGKRDIRISIDGEYLLSSGDGTGGMKFPSDLGGSQINLREGIEDIKTQQVTMKIPILKQIDSKIRTALQKEKIIAIKKPDIEEIFMDRIMDKFQNGGDKEILEEIEENIDGGEIDADDSN